MQFKKVEVDFAAQTVNAVMEDDSSVVLFPEGAPVAAADTEVKVEKSDGTEEDFVLKQ